MTERYNCRYFIFHQSIFSRHMRVKMRYLKSIRDKCEIKECLFHLVA